MEKSPNTRGLSILEEVHSEQYIADIIDREKTTSEKEPGILLFSLDKEGTILSLEGNLSERLDISKSELLGSSIFETGNLHHKVFKYIRDALSNRHKTYTFIVDENVYTFYYTATRNLQQEVAGVLGVLIDVTEQKRVENIVVRKNEHIKLLYEASKSLSESLNVSQLYKTLFDIVTQAAPCDSLLVVSYCEEKNVIQSTHMQVKSVNETIDISNIPPIPLAPEGQGMMSRVIRTGKTLLINDHQNYDVATKVLFTIRADGIEENPKEKLSGSSLIVPVRLHDKVIGAVKIHSDRINAYDRDMVEFIETLMNPVSLAIRNAMLYKEAQDEISVRRKAETELTESLREKELLLGEIHHRVRNNLQLILSMLNFQSKYIKDEYSSVVFKESISRIKAISLIQDKLYKDPSMSKIDFSSYIKSLVGHLRETYNTKQNNIRFKIKADDIYMNIDTAVPAGLIVNEIITNSIEHAFPGGRHGEIKIEMYLENSGSNLYHLRVMDNGIGMPTSFDDIRKQSLGMSIINSLSRQLNGTLKYNSGEGADVIFEFPSADYKQRI